MVPFVGGESVDPSGGACAGLPAATMRVEPDKVLMRRVEDRRDKIRDFIETRRDLLINVPAPGADPCSEWTVAALGANGESAVAAARAYVAQLTAVVDALAEMARIYGLVEDVNEAAFRRVWDE